MKKTIVMCVTAALIAFSSVPAAAAGPLTDKAVALAAQDSGAGISDICYAVYKAVKESPDEADVVFSQVISQRTTWTSGEVYAIFRAVLLARPDLEKEFRAHAATYKPTQGEGGKEVYSGDVAKDPMVAKLLNALHEASLPDGVVPAVLNALVNDPMDLASINEGVMQGDSGGAGGDMPTVPDPDIPTPPAMSPQN